MSQKNSKKASGPFIERTLYLEGSLPQTRFFGRSKKEPSLIFGAFFDLPKNQFWVPNGGNPQATPSSGGTLQHKRVCQLAYDSTGNYTTQYPVDPLRGEHPQLRRSSTSFLGVCMCMRHSARQAERAVCLQKCNPHCKPRSGGSKLRFGDTSQYIYQ